MSVQEPNHELDDELLSAYLDDELSPEERAAVEARLAADPAAQQLLHELKSVSQSVQAMPLETVGRDLSDEILRRAREAKQPAAVAASRPRSISLRSQPAPLGDVTPRISIFRTTRAWIWASLAVAAGLVIMVIERGDERAKNLPVVAERTERRIENQSRPEKELVQLRREDSILADRKPASTAADGRSMAESTPALAPAVKSAPSQPIAPSEVDGLAKSGAGGTSINSAVGAPKTDSMNSSAGHTPAFAKAPVGQPAPVDFNTLPQSASAAPTGPGLNINASGGKLKAAAQQKPLVVVHVVAKRAAFDKKSFDDVLRREGITFESAPTNERPPQPAKDYFGSADEKKASEANILRENALANQDFDIVFVEASEPKIASCLANLHQDTEDFTSVAVEPPAQADRATAPTKKLAEDLGQYNRGIVTQRQKDSRASVENYYRYYSLDLPKEQPAASPRGGDLSTRAAAPDAKSTVSLGGKHAALGEEGRARRIQLSDSSKLQADSDKRAGGGPDGGYKMKELAQKVKKQAMAETEKLHVLFVFTPEEAVAPSAPPANKTK